MKRAYVKFYTDWLCAIEKLNAEDQLRALKAIIRYGEYGEMPTQDEIGLFPYIILTTAKGQIDLDIKAEEEKEKKARLYSEAGKRGAEKRWSNVNNDVKNEIGGYNGANRVANRGLSQKETIPPCPPKEKEKESTKERVKEITPLYPPLKEKGLEKTCVFSVGTPVGAHDHTHSPLYTFIINNWNEIFSEKLPKITKITEQRKAKINARLPLWKKLAEERNCDVQTLLKSVFEKIKVSKFLLGDNDRGWRADFDWFVKSDQQTIRTLEGGYEYAEPKQKTEVETIYANNNVNDYWKQRAKELGKSI